MNVFETDWLSNVVQEAEFLEYKANDPRVWIYERLRQSVFLWIIKLLLQFDLLLVFPLFSFNVLHLHLLIFFRLDLFLSDQPTACSSGLHFSDQLPVSFFPLPFSFLFPLHDLFVLFPHSLGSDGDSPLEVV